MPNDVVRLVKNNLCLNEDLDDLDFHLGAAAPTSFEKFHLLSLLYPILESENVHESCKTKVIQLLMKHSDTLRIMMRYGSKEISQIIYEAEAKVRNIG
ncbi:MAG: hypothetical protein CL942_15825 [Desulfovibrio sp.]|nr:hypothetical protein [Desulfovibrio sp.]MBC18342.1 hypothetical protein [Desulfovibrio sp.]MBC18506.1 hypothetical protein [Desulfovibrio sp.]|tara:strand:- start:3586 stop:3879 length:294 start_codon:yes stop_codon:yes gene_type:complete